jgi:hypothetical protein
MALKELVVPEPGKKKMVRMNVPGMKKTQSKKADKEQDPDLEKYFGTDVNLD